MFQDTRWSDRGWKQKGRRDFTLPTSMSNMWWGEEIEEFLNPFRYSFRKTSSFSLFPSSRRTPFSYNFFTSGSESSDNLKAVFLLFLHFQVSRHFFLSLFGVILVRFELFPLELLCFLWVFQFIKTIEFWWTIERNI